MTELGKCSNGYCEIPAGTFRIGSTDSYLDEQPVKDITMTSFELGQTEVSVSDYQAYQKTASTQWQAVLSGCSSGNASQSLFSKVGETFQAFYERASQIFSSNSCKEIEITKNIPALPDFDGNKKGDDYPIVGLTFNEKRAYCQAQGGDLPTAAQLHYASQFDVQDSATEGGKMVYRDNSLSTVVVNSGYKNRLGVYNLLGNVWESALDAYDQYFYARMASQDPYNPLTDQSTQPEEFSGGSFNDFQEHAGPNRRISISSIHRNEDIGFRCARPIK